MKPTWFLLLLFLPAVGAGQVPGRFDWVHTEGGGWLTGFAQHPGSGRLYARTDVGGIYRSDDHGDHWTFLSGDFVHRGSLFVQGIAVSPADPDRVYLAAGVSYHPDDPGRGVWRSLDGGTRWSHVLPDVNFSGNDNPRHGGECLFLHPSDPDEVYAASRGQGLWRSLDGGDQWSRIDGTVFNGAALCGVLATAGFPDQLLVYGEGGLWFSADRGSSWTRVFSAAEVLRAARRPDGALFVIETTANPGNPDDTKLWRYSAIDWSNPSTWSRTNLYPRYLDAFEAANGYRRTDKAGVLTLLAGGGLVTGPFFDQLGISADLGDTFSLLPMTALEPQPRWTTVPPGNARLGGGYNQLRQDAGDPARWYVTGGYGPARTDDAGQTWRYITTGVNEVVTWKTRFHPADPDRILLPAADHGLAVLTNQSASLIAGGYIARHVPWPGDILAFAHTAFFHGDRIIAPGGDGIAQEPRLYVSHDNGATWGTITPTGVPMFGGAPWIDGVAAADDPDELLLLRGGSFGPDAGGVYRSVDGGQSFSWRRLPPDAVFWPDGSTFWGGDEFVQFAFLLADGGGGDTRYLWERYKGLFRSADRGATWSSVHPSGLSGAAGYADGRPAADTAVAGRLWLAAVDGLWTSPDGGDSWTSAGGFAATRHVDANDGQVVVQGRRAGDGFDRLYYSPNLGETWTEISRPGFRFPNITGLALDPWRRGTVWISTDGLSTIRFTPAATIASIALERSDLVVTVAPAGAGWRLNAAAEPAGPFEPLSLGTFDGSSRFAIPLADVPWPARFFQAVQ